jgi:hypothetical protein
LALARTNDSLSTFSIRSTGMKQWQRLAIYSILLLIVMVLITIVLPRFLP